MKYPNPPFPSIDPSWSLFLDRDGVINYDKDGSYIFHTDEFRIYDGVPDAIATFNQHFGHVFVVTNQRGVGKRLMTEKDLSDIHEQMLQLFAQKKGHIDRIYYCTSLNNDHPDRKPNPGHAFRAAREFSINLERSIMVGNKMSDMQFGRNAGMKTVYIATTHPEVGFPHPDIDWRFDLLTDFAKALTGK